MPTNVLVLNKSWLVTGAGAPEGVHAGPVGSVYLREDGGTGTSLYIKESGSGNTGWVAVAPSAGGGAPAAHAPTHKTGGSDPIKLDELGSPTDTLALNVSTSAHGLMQKYPGGTTTYLRADGVFATVPAPAVAPHATTHQAGGSDPVKLDALAAPTDVSTLNASTSTHGLLRKLSNVATQYLDGTGAWTVPPVGGTWTVGAGAIILNRYTVIGKTVHWSLYVSWFSGSNTIAGTVTGLNVFLPAITFTTPIYQRVAYGIDAGVLAEMLCQPTGGSAVQFFKMNGTNFTAGTTTGFMTTMTWEIT